MFSVRFTFSPTSDTTLFNSSSAPRFYAIDGLRFLAAFSVLLFHYTFSGFAADAKTILAFPELSLFTRYGYLGVDLFFMISGFVILMSAQHVSPSSFVISRIVRLYPAFWVAVTLTTVVILLIGAPRYSIEWTQYWANMTMIGGFFNIELIDGVYWSLLVELKFYGLILILLLLRQIKYIQIFLTGWLLISLINAIIPLPEIIQTLLFPRWAGYFIAGATCYLISQEKISWAKIVILALSYSVCIRYALWHIATLSRDYQTTFLPYIVIAMITLFYGILLAISMRYLQLKHSPGILLAGSITYPLYLIHQNIGFILFNQLAMSFLRYEILIIVTFIVFGFAYLINHFIEEPYAPYFKSFLKKILTVSNSNSQKI